MCTAWAEAKMSLPFSRALRNAPDRSETERLLPTIKPYLELSSFQGPSAVKKKRELFPGNREASGRSDVLPQITPTLVAEY